MTVQIQENVALAPLTTMKVGGNARFFVRVKSVEELEAALLFAHERELPIFILGGGANTLVSQDGFSGLVIKMEMKGIVYDDNRVTVQAGEWWDDVVKDVVAHDLWGIENLSLVPGTLGGAVTQNIGAYGTEIRDTICSVDALDIEKLQVITFSREECEFDYRESIFKKNKNLIILRATFELKKDAELNIDYEEVKKYFESAGVVEPRLLEIRDAVVAIRRAKLPAPPIGSAGSFFKNPVVSAMQYEALKKQYPEIKANIQGDNTIKLSAAWLIDHVGGWRGYRKGDAGVHEKQALILVNHGNASAEEIISLAQEIKNDINKKTNVSLEEEVVVL